MKLPKKIFLVEESNDNEKWFNVTCDAKDFAMAGETVEVGEYQLVAVRKVTAQVAIK